MTKHNESGSGSTKSSSSSKFRNVLHLRRSGGNNFDLIKSCLKSWAYARGWLGWYFEVTSDTRGFRNEVFFRSGGSEPPFWNLPFTESFGIWVLDVRAIFGFAPQTVQNVWSVFDLIKSFYSKLGRTFYTQVGLQKNRHCKCTYNRNKFHQYHWHMGKQMLLLNQNYHRLQVILCSTSAITSPYISVCLYVYTVIIVSEAGYCDTAHDHRKSNELQSVEIALKQSCAVGCTCIQTSLDFQYKPVQYKVKYCNSASMNMLKKIASLGQNDTYSNTYSTVYTHMVQY